jgi:plasmid stability protein
MMRSFTIKGIPDDLLDRLRKRAEHHRRSLNSEVLHLLERSVSSAPLPSSARLARIRRLQERVPLPPLTDEALEKAIGEGRP